MILWLLFTGAEFDILFSEHGAAVVVKPDREGEMSLASRLPSPFAHSIIYQISGSGLVLEPEIYYNVHIGNEQCEKR